MKVLSLLGLLGVAVLLPAQSTITVEGVVVDAVTGAGISGAAVQVLGNANETLTNEAGMFRATVFTVPEYLVVVRKQGYLTKGPARVRADADGKPARLELIPSATIRGRVVGGDGKPARGSVELGPSFRETAHVNEDGYFTFDRLSPGTYTLLARPESAEPVSTPEGLRTALVPTYYPSAVERTQAEPIAVRAGADLNGYEIRLQTAPVYRISGVVLDLDGNPAADAIVQLLDKVSDGFNGYSGGRQVFFIRRSSIADASSTTQSTTTADDGTFEFASVRPGDWTLRVESDSVRDEIHQRDVVLFGSEIINLGRRDLDDVKVRLRMPFDLSGTVDGADALPDTVRSVMVTLTGETGFFGGSARPDARGTFQIEGLIPGRYLISAEADTNHYASVFLSSSEVTGQTVELTASSPPMRVLLKPGGTVRWTLDQQPSSWTVLVLPQRLTGFGYYVSDLMRASQLSGIPPGEYYAIALDRFDPRSMSDADRLRGFIPRATSVRVEAGADAFVQLKINHVTD